MNLFFCQIMKNIFVHKYEIINVPNYENIKWFKYEFIFVSNYEKYIYTQV